MKKAFQNASADVISGYVFTILGFLVVLGSWAMPDFSELGASWYEAPGLTPGLLGAALSVCGVLLVMRAPTVEEQGEDKLSSDQDEPMLELLKDPKSRQRVYITASLCVFYALVMVGLLPFWLATALFVFAFIFGFEYEPGCERALLYRRAMVALIIALATSVAVTLVFQELFLVRLP
ncbi:tripartite tricarboxylate transporter TctB family protein [Rhodobacteraceae bacterium RKSG542]|uniref:tripartite tricarboxylate transporter TctB family protein n=1 Tax=Pseudovibrio flavus TaxID=2529854 RepID=UPI0012BC6103|nr:tripartite tricarboxylate transporter TctB family protein [Pseudovibrio flavus]MTI15739.1 tripartite tricarboxylate transporter TctB family protein [Pseudovibrio flavus]